MKTIKLFILLLSLITILLFTGCTSEVENQSMTIDYNGNTYNGVYSGVVVDGVPNGNGFFKCGDPDEGDNYLAYNGNWENGEFKGEGVLGTDNYSFSIASGEVGVTLDCTGIYAGEVLNGEPNGNGALLYGEEGSDDYLYYNGEWKSGIFSGEGELTTSYYNAYVYFDGVSDKTSFLGKYDGNTLNGLANGKGKITAISNSGEELFTYSGDWENGLWNGYGVVDFTDDYYYDEIGNFVNGAFAPGAADLITSIGTVKSSCPFSLSDGAYNFIDSNEKVFLDHNKEEIDKLGLSTFDLGVFKKNPSTYVPCLVELDWLHIQQAMEEQLGGYTITFILAYDSDWNYYWLHCIGTSDVLVEGNNISVIFMPLGYSTYETVQGDNQWAISGVIAY